MAQIDAFKKYFKPVPEEPNKINSSVCSNCIRCCCQTMGCHISPEDLNEISVENIIGLIDESQCVSIDYWEGNPVTGAHDYRGYYLRMRNHRTHVIDPAYHGICSILTDTGCPLPFTHRPKGGRELIPNPNADCFTGYTKQQCAIDWMKYRDIMEQVYQHYHDLGDETENSIADILLGGLLFGGLL